MEPLFNNLKTNPLFKGIGISDFEAMLKCMDGRVQAYPKGQTVLLAGNPVEAVGLVVSGLVQVVREDSEGRQNLMAELGEGELFGEVFACAGVSHSPVSVIAVEPSQILRINFRRIIVTCSASCGFHQRLIENMLALVARKNLLLNQKIEILSKRTIRDRLLLYFEFARNGAKRFTIPYSREELAAYLCVDRSAMSAELSKMQNDELLCYERNRFELL